MQEEPHNAVEDNLILCQFNRQCAWLHRVRIESYSCPHSDLHALSSPFLCIDALAHASQQLQRLWCSPLPLDVSRQVSRCKPKPRPRRMCSDAVAGDTLVSGGLQLFASASPLTVSLRAPAHSNGACANQINVKNSPAGAGRLPGRSRMAQQLPCPMASFPAAADALTRLLTTRPPSSASRSCASVCSQAEILGRL